jgi:hypothetical protein
MKFSRLIPLAERLQANQLKVESLEPEKRRLLTLIARWNAAAFISPELNFKRKA